MHYNQIMSLAVLLIPDFALILFGFFLNRFTDWGRNFWSGLEKLIYYVLFPALLFNSIAKTKIESELKMKMLKGGHSADEVVQSILSRCERESTSQGN